MVIGVLGLVLGTGPLVVVMVVDPKSTAIGPGLLMVVTVPPSVLSLAAGLGVRRWVRERAAGEGDTGTVERARYDRPDRAA